MASVLEWIIAFLILTGATFALIGSIGLARLPDFFMRLHGPTKATTLGVGSMIIGSMIFFGATDKLNLHELLITLFLFISAPVSAHIVGKAALHIQLPVEKRTKNIPWAEKED